MLAARGSRHTRATAAHEPAYARTRTQAHRTTDRNDRKHRNDDNHGENRVTSRNQRTRIRPTTWARPLPLAAAAAGLAMPLSACGPHDDGAKGTDTKAAATATPTQATATATPTATSKPQETADDSAAAVAPSVFNDSAHGTYRCTTGASVLVNGSGSDLHLTGGCGTVLVNGAGSSVEADSAARIFVNGANASVTYHGTSQVAVNGAGATAHRAP